MNLILEQNKAMHYMTWNSMGPWKAVEEVTIMRRTDTHVSASSCLVYESQATAAIPERVFYPIGIVRTELVRE